jgi:hypothetical protein
LVLRSTSRNISVKGPPLASFAAVGLPSTLGLAPGTTIMLVSIVWATI